MSGCSGSIDCPRCGGKDTLMTYSDWKPFDTASGECLKCGFVYGMTYRLMSLEELNSRRKDFEKRPLKEMTEPKDKEFDNCYILEED